MDSGSQYKLKISIDNTNSDDEDSDSGSDDLKHNRRPKTFSKNQSGDDVSKDRESDNDERTLSVALDTDRPTVSEQRIKTYKNKAGTFVVGFDPTSEECRERQEQRAKRFGDTVLGVVPVTDEAIQKLYESLGVSPTSDKEDGGDTRFDAIHIIGVDDMSTSRVFDYFGEFAPAAIEWIDDTSCNVVWMDRILAARAMLKMSTDKAATPEDNGAESSEIDIQKDIVNAVNEGETASAVAATETEEPKSMEEDDDDLNLLSDDDVAKLSRSTVTAEENRAEVEKRRSSVAEDRGLSSKAIATEAGQEDEEDMEVDDETSAVTKRQESSRPDRRPSVALETDQSANRKRRQRIRSREKSVEMPPGKWRIGIPHLHNKRLYMRFATKADVKQRGAGKRSKYYQKYGNPNFGGMRGIISESRKRKMFSKKYHDELDEARKAIEEAKWKRGIPDETKFDQHVEEAVSKRPRVAREPEEPVSPIESDDSLNELVVEQSHRDVRRPAAKSRFMRMHADEEQSRSLSDRLGVRNHTRVSSNVRDRLGLTESSDMDRDSRHRSGTRREISGDLRSRLGRR